MQNEFDWTVNVHYIYLEEYAETRNYIWCPVRAILIARSALKKSPVTHHAIAKTQSTELRPHLPYLVCWFLIIMLWLFHVKVPLHRRVLFRLKVLSIYNYPVHIYFKMVIRNSSYVLLKVGNYCQLQIYLFCFIAYLKTRCIHFKHWDTFYIIKNYK